MGESPLQYEELTRLFLETMGEQLSSEQLLQEAPDEVSFSFPLTHPLYLSLGRPPGSHHG